MSKTLLQLRTAFVVLLASLQLFLLPATHVLHLGCQHSHDHGPTAAFSVFDAVEAAWTWCSSSHSCDHCSKTARAADDHPTDSPPVHPPHDEDSCPLCQAVFAARTATTAAVDLTITEPVSEFLAENSQVPDSTPRHCLLSRGPPTAFRG